LEIAARFLQVSFEIMLHGEIHVRIKEYLAVPGRAALALC
jgi:hypothetical protein